MKKDDIYRGAGPGLNPFEFNEQVAEVFDDMLHRSVPLYAESLRQQARLAAAFYREGTKIYDLGCSHGNFALALLAEMRQRPFELVAVDTSEPMLCRFRARLPRLPWGQNVSLHCLDLREAPLAKASVILLNLTLQFVPVCDRDAMVARAFSSLEPGGILLVTEKVRHEDAEMDGLEQRFYYDFKRSNGYSDIEISRKRDALEDVLVAETVQDHQDRFARAGFEAVDLYLKWFNFASFLCRKGPGGPA